MLLYYITDRRQFPGDARDQRARLLDKIAEAARCGVDFIQLREKDLSARELELLAREAVQVVRENSLPNPHASQNRANVSHPEIENSHPSAQTRGARAGHPESGDRVTRLLINSRTDIALACGADGVHLTSTDISAADARAVWSMALAFPVSRSPFSVNTANAEIVDRESVSTENEKSPPFPLPLASLGVGVRMGHPGNWIIAVSCHTPAEVRMAEAQGADFAVFAPVFGKTTFPQTPGVGLAALRAACSGAAAAKNVEGVPAGRMPVLALGGITLENARACVDAGAAGIAAVRLFQESDIALVVERLRRE
ncbi:MAG: thiamine phosphate synthase [Terriglobales bacterium]